MSRKTIGQSMRACRQAKGVTIVGLADAAGIRPCDICRYEHDDYYPRLLTLVVLADVLNVTIDEYIGRVTREQ